MAEPDGCPTWQTSHEDQCGAFKTHDDVSDMAACKALCTPDALGPGKPCMAIMFSTQLKNCNLYEEQNGCPTGQEEPPSGYQQLLKMCPADACQLSKRGACELSTTGWVFVCVVLLAALVYATLGTMYNMKAKGLTLSVDAFPHRAFWAEIQGLCSDGVALVVRTASGDRQRGVSRGAHADGKGTGYTAVPDVGLERSASEGLLSITGEQQQKSMQAAGSGSLATPSSLGCNNGSSSGSSGSDSNAYTSDDEIIE